MNDATTADTPDQAPEGAPHQRRWPRRLAIGLAITGALAAAGYWYLGRESTLQMLVQRVADASGGSVTVTGVSGSLYGAMHMDKVVFKSPTQLITAENLDIDWSPLQYFSKGIAVNKLHVMSLRLDTLKESEKATMPVSLEAPFKLDLNDARINKVTTTNQGASTVIADVRFNLSGGKQKWTLENGSAITPWGYAKAEGSIGAQRPFKLDAKASLTQLVPKGQDAAQVNMQVTGDLETTQVVASGRSGRATGDARLTLSPYSDIPLRAMAINGQNLDPGFFNPNLPTADLTVNIAARVDDKRNVKGSVNIVNQGPVGTIDKDLLPLRAMRGDLSGDLSALKIDGAVIDFGEAGKFTGGGNIVPTPDDKSPPTARFALHTDRLNLKQLHSRMKATAIAGDLSLTSVNETQTFSAKLVEDGMRLVAEATLADNILKIANATVTAGSSTVSLAGNASLADQREFKVTASADNFNPANFGDYPAADINAVVNANGFLAPEWRLAADFALRPSRLFGQALSGKGKFNANAQHIDNVQATLALGNNSADIRGAFGLPGEKLLWRVEGRQLGALRDNMYGTLVAKGAVTGTMAMPRTSFEVDASGLGWAPLAKAASAGTLRASGDAWLTAPAKDGSRSVEVKATGAANRFNPAAFGAFLPGSINATFSGAGTLAKDWRGNLNVALQPSTLGTAPLDGHARLTANSRHVTNADIDLRLGVNSAVAKGSFGAPGDALTFRIDAPQLSALGPGFGGAMRGAGTLSGSMDAPSVNATLDGQNLKFFGQHSIGSIKASANVGSGRGAADPLVTDIVITDYAMGERRIDAARLQSSGTRGAHTISFSGRNAAGEASGEVRGGLNGNVWKGTIAALQNKGRYAFTLRSPVPVRIAGAPGSGLMGLMSPASLSVGNAVIALPAGSINLASLEKSAGRWTSKGSASGVPLNYLAQFSPAMRENLTGDLTIGADWAFDMRAPVAKGAAPALSGSFHVFREKGDLIVGNEVPVVLDLRTLDLRADVVGGALRTQLRFDGAKAGQATVDATTTLVRGRLNNASPMRMTVNADMTSVAWMAPLAGQPGLELGGSLKMALTGGGTIGNPTLNGTINGDNLAVRWAEQGVKLRNGQLRAQLAGDQLLLQRLAFDGVQGTATADGNVRFSGGEATMQLKLVADKLEILSRPDRTLVITGQSTLLRNAQRFSLEGKFRADRALIELAPQDRPTLSDDVIVLGRTAKATKVDQTPAIETMPLALDMQLDLGDYFRLRGMGINAELTGQVHLRGTAEAPRANGTIRVVSGTYKAYGQNLTIERGVLTFSGRVDNPALNILAVRRRPDSEPLSETNVQAGVEVHGTALSPVAKLVSTPNVSDSEKLSWLVLGHGMEGISGNEKSVLTAAAGALLGGKGGGFQSRLANSLGVDELGLSSADGLESTVVTVGKRLSSRAYLSFEQGATSASSLVKLRYKLTPKITLQFQTGTNTALDILYTWAYD
ncbi:translocation/assembly module TamB domain-containing protein [Massilia sp. PAMC28688]|uniref:translocation/assembly module TamB domain-containing protein n=1 Tax=Massilia sp. PAMC28688 TaxID=2861283 RepID=UPI001C624CAA|nr:translocation/assembly module TamB domain-containing protein [Massilia sp. PAMC28688]QYF94691.1 translocation/assembly module TamB domain-containing protein [Massilia sp. PAMC28688]